MEDADSLPAVGRVWDSGPKRSLSEILAAAARQKQAQQVPSARPSPAGSSELGVAWGAILEQVKEAMGPAVHVPLSSGEPRRDGADLRIRFGGAFAAMARYLEKYRDPIQAIVAANLADGPRVVFEADFAAPIRPMPAGNAGGVPPAPRPLPSPGAGMPAKEGVPLTPDLRAELEKDPLIRAIMETFSGSIVKVE